MGTSPSSEIPAVPPPDYEISNSEEYDNQILSELEPLRNPNSEIAPFPTQNIESALRIICLHFNYGDNKSLTLELAKQIQFSCKIQGITSFHKATSYRILGSCYYKLGENSKSIKHHLEALSIYQKNNGIERVSIEVAKSYTDLGQVYYDQKSHKKAVKYCQKALRIIRSNNAGNEMVAHEALMLLGYSYLGLKKYDESLIYFSQSERVLEKQPRLLIYTKAGVIYGIANVYMKKKRYQEAIDHFERVLEKMELLGNEGKYQYASISTISLIGSCYYEMGNYNTAIRYIEDAYKQSLRISPMNKEFVATLKTNFELAKKKKLKCEMKKNKESSKK